MRGKWLLMRVLLVGLMLGAIVGLSMARDAQSEGGAAPQVLVGTAFTYQGRLDKGGSPYTGLCDFRFSLHDALSGGSQIGVTQTVATVDVVHGLFTVALNGGNEFGAGAFTGEGRWLAIEVRCTGDGSYTPLDPRQALTAAPYALALPGLWTQQNTTSPNLIGGYWGNSITAGVMGATIGGGGGSGGLANSVTDDYGTVGGGLGNQAGDDAGATDDTICATVGGGSSNTARGTCATVAGGNNNASGPYAFVGGGSINAASGNGATVGGGGLNLAGGSQATIGGGMFNEATADYATVGGGFYNQATADYATVGGGGGSTPATGNRVTDDYGLVGGGRNNRAGNGDGDTANAAHATVGGGEGNAAGNGSATVGGGYSNTADGYAATIGGGGSNEANYSFDTVGGGYDNAAGGDTSTIGGGRGNTTDGYAATVGGGEDNSASGNRATVGGGWENNATGGNATVPGGRQNTALGSNSFAAGTRAKANGTGSFVWGDSTWADVASTGNNQFIVRASGGIWFGMTSSPSIPPGRFINTSTGGYLSIGGVWTDSSDRDLKENYSPVDGQKVLARLSGLPITTWNYKAEEPTSRHMGPTAQDFYAVFGLGQDDHHIAPLDASGVALVAVQELYARNQALEAENDAQQAQIDDLQARLAALESRVGGGASSPWRGGLLLPGSGLLVVGLGVVWVARRKGGGGR